VSKEEAAQHLSQVLECDILEEHFFDDAWGVYRFNVYDRQFSVEGEQVFYHGKTTLGLRPRKISSLKDLHREISKEENRDKRSKLIIICSGLLLLALILLLVF
jgi:hypothetical protein